DAMFQWWYGHNAVGFFLTAGFLAIMYYFIPKRAERPIYSYRLSVIHFWSLIFLYIWAGPHHLHYTALPDWAQTLGMTFSVILWMPSWGGMINGLMTLSGAWDKLRTDPVLRMMVVSVAFYGMATFEGPLMSIKSVNSLSHYTDWTIGHVHSGALGWVAFVSFGAIYCLVPWLWNRERLYSLKLVNWHFWISTIGIVVYISSMWVSGILQGLMWRAYTNLGFLEYSFVETVEAMHPFYVIRAIGGALFLAGALLMVWNIWKTIAGDVAAAKALDPAPALAPGEGGARHVAAIGLGEEIDPAPVRRAGRDRDRRPGRDHAAVLPQQHHREGRRGAALYAARARRPQYLCARGLLQLPFADDPHAARRGRALRPLFAGGREHVRSPVPVGIEANRPGPCAHRRQILRRLASRAPPLAEIRRADDDHAGLSVACEDGARLCTHRRRPACAGDARRPLYGRDDRERGGRPQDAGDRGRARCRRARQALSEGAVARLRRQSRHDQRGRRAHRLSAAARHAGRLQALRRQGECEESHADRLALSRTRAFRSDLGPRLFRRSVPGDAGLCAVAVPPAPFRGGGAHPAA